MNYTIYTAIRKKLNLKFLYKGKSLIIMSPWIYGRRLDFFEIDEESILGFVFLKDFDEVAYIDYFSTRDIYDERIVSGNFFSPTSSSGLGQWNDIYISVTEKKD